MGAGLNGHTEAVAVGGVVVEEGPVDLGAAVHGRIGVAAGGVDLDNGLMKQRVVAKVLRVDVVPHHGEHVLELAFPGLAGVDSGGEVLFAGTAAGAVHANGVSEVVVAEEVLDLVEVLAELVKNLGDAAGEALGLFGVLLQRLLLSEAVVVELGDALVLAAKGGVGALGGLLFDDDLHLLTELALLRIDSVHNHAAIGNHNKDRVGRKKKEVTM